MANRWGNNGNSERLSFLGAPKSLQMVTAAMKLKRCLLLGRKAMTHLDSILKTRDITLPTNVHLVKAMVFPVWMWELDYKESWVLKNWCLWTMVLEKTLESPLDSKSKEFKSVNPKGNQPWIFIGRTDAEAPILRPPDVKSWLIGKDPDAGKDWRQVQKGMTEDEMFGWHHRLDMSFSKLQEIVEDREVWRSAVHGVTKSQTWLSDRTTTKVRWKVSSGELKLKQCIVFVIKVILRAHCKQFLSVYALEKVQQSF